MSDLAGLLLVAFIGGAIVASFALFASAALSDGRGAKRNEKENR